MWRNWQTRMVQVHVPVKGVEVQLLSPALFFFRVGVTFRGQSSAGGLRELALPANPARSCRGNVHRVRSPLIDERAAFFFGGLPPRSALRTVAQTSSDSIAGIGPFARLADKFHRTVTFRSSSHFGGFLSPDPLVQYHLGTNICARQSRYQTCWSPLSHARAFSAPSACLCLFSTARRISCSHERFPHCCSSSASCSR